MRYPRILRPPARKSWFLFGPRQTGKSTLVRSLLRENDFYVDLLPQRSYLSYAKDRGRLREELLTHHRRCGTFTCIIDEVQKIPGILDEVHELIESLGLRFILTGSSTRKLLRANANLLAGRAYVHHLFPLTFGELGEAFDLDRALRFGCLPPIWGEDEEDEREFLRAYTETYLSEEVAQEGHVRNLAPFSQFLDIAAAIDGEIVNFTSMARECGVSVKTVQQYYEILEQTFIAHRLPGWMRSARRRLTSNPRYYMFDTGVTNALSHNLGRALDPVSRGRRFEQLVITQIAAHISYARLDWKLYYWRTNHGAEVDLLICEGDRILAGIEIKSTRSPARVDTKGISSFMSDNPEVPCFILGIDQRERRLESGIVVMDWKEFIEDRLGEL